MKTVLITGAGSGFGLGASLELARRGHTVIAATETEAQAASLRRSHPQLKIVKLDITTDDVDQVDDMDVDVLINNAGVGLNAPIADFPIEKLRVSFEVNVFGTYAITQRVLRRMIPKRSGRIIIMSSLAGLVSGPGSAPYAMTKHALQAFGRSLRTELAPLGIDVALLNPGPYATGFNDRMAASVWDHLNETSIHHGDAEMFRDIGRFMTNNQLDPAEIASVLADMTEATTTRLQNIHPPSFEAFIKERLGR
jgi:NAD(P)-dependent dehydrogenase (short-subunit alcohol dehydrogenase family)